MTDFDRALALILRFEGGKVDDPQDPGGRTAFGITQRTYDRFRVDAALPLADVWEISAADVEKIYLERFWNRGHCEGMTWPLCLIHFDCCVNVGTESKNAQGQPKTSAITLLQRALRLPDDGVWGPHTAGSAGNPVGTSMICYRYLLTRMVYYLHLDDKHPERLKFFNAWLGRLETLYNEVP